MNQQISIYKKNLNGQKSIDWGKMSNEFNINILQAWDDSKDLPNMVIKRWVEYYEYCLENDKFCLDCSSCSERIKAGTHKKLTIQEWREDKGRCFCGNRLTWETFCSKYELDDDFDSY
tara:strand:+ start:187 stop:540 length:354 start_codon:yes stop_codon:yes gene_type:complete